MDYDDRLRAAIAAQEALRGTVPDDIVNAAIAALRAQLESPTPTARTKQRKLITVVFADVTGSTELGEQLDAEELSDRFDVLWHHLDAVIERHGGRIDKHIGDAVMALWGADHAREDDPEQAIRAALEMRAAVAGLAADGVTPGLQMRIGVNTGPVVLGAIASTDEFTAMGDTVNVAARLESATPPGTILVGHDTYRHVRGVFSVRAREPLTVKGKRSPLRTYLVDGVRPRAFRLPTRGIEGVETSMIGRDAELDRLRAALARTIESSTPTIVTIVGEAGTGKSRLLYEFEDWLRVQPEEVRLFRGRAESARRGAPYALIRDLLFGRFEIADDDPRELALAKLTVGFRELAGDELAADAPIVGHLVGIELDHRPPEARDLADRAVLALTRLLERTAVDMPVVVLLEDLHWADRASLEMLERLGGEISDVPVLVIGVTRPVMDRAGIEPGDGAIVLEPLSDRETALLVDEVLQQLPEIPDRLRDDIVRAAAGHPFYVEELVRMMIDEGAIVVDGAQWELRPDRLGQRSIPSTVAGVLQARLDLLGASERTVLQRAAVVGPVFWDIAVPRVDCTADPVPADLDTALAALAARGLVERAATSDVTGAAEYQFQHAILHEVVYETVLLQDRRLLHRDVAEWMARRDASALSAFTVAHHFSAAGAERDAAGWYARAGAQARRRFAVDEAIDACRAALDPDVLDDEATLDVLDDLCECLSISARYDDALSTSERMERLAASIGDDRRRALALMLRSHLHLRQGRSREALGEAERAHELTLRAGSGSDDVVESITEIVWVLVRLGRLHEAVERGHRGLAALDATTGGRVRRGLHSALGVAHYGLGAYSDAAAHLAEALTLDRQHGDRRGEAANLVNLGEVARLQGDLPLSIARYRDALTIVREIGDRDQEALVLSNLGGAYVETGEISDALDHLAEAVRRFERTGGTEHSSETHRFLAEAHLARGDLGDAGRAAREAMRLAELDENPDHLGHAWRLLGLVGARAAATTPAEECDVLDPEHCLTTAASVFEEAAMQRERALTLADLADVVDAGGDADRAAALRAEARGTLASLGLSDVLGPDGSEDP